MGVTFPILYDTGGAVHTLYSQQSAEGTIYPQDWIIGVDGRVKYVNNGYDAAAMIAVIEAELSQD